MLDVLSDANRHILCELGKLDLLEEREFISRFGRDRMDDLETAGYIRKVVIVPPLKEDAYKDGLYGYRITASGRDAIELFEKIRSDQAKNEEEKRLQKQSEEKRFRKNARNEWIRWAIDAFVTIGMFIAGLIVEHYSSPFQRFLELLKGLW